MARGETLRPTWRPWLRLARWPYVHAVLWPILFGLATTAQAFNAVQEGRRNHLPYATWEPFAWEYSSLIGSLLGTAVVFCLFRQLRGRSSRAWIAGVGVALIGFAVIHIGLMVALRELLYAALDRNYDFGDLRLELPYELRKDAPTVGLLLAGFWLVEFLRDLAPGGESPKYERSRLAAEDHDRILERIEACVRTQQIHRDPNLTLARLARAVGAPPNHVSQVLNVRSDGFHAWLAAARVADAQTMLLQGEDVSGLLDAAYAVGFNSKSTFYEAFRKSTGLTPGAWRAQQLSSANAGG